MQEEPKGCAPDPKQMVVERWLGCIGRDETAGLGQAKTGECENLALSRPLGLLARGWC